jgi:hypothetical protein
MGGVLSEQKPPDQNKASIDEIVEFILPIYYGKLHLLPEEREKLVHSWKLITNNFIG